MRVMWESMSFCMEKLGKLYPGLHSDKDRFNSAFGNTKFIHLERQDKVAQAVSRLRAEQSGLWHIHPDGSERERLSEKKEPIYTECLIDEFIEESEQHHGEWRTWFTRNAVEPLELSYEDLAANPLLMLRRVLEYLSLDTSAVDRIQPRTAKLADTRSREWMDRYRLEKGVDG